MAEREVDAAESGSVVYIVDHDGIGSVAAFSSRAKASAFIGSGDGPYHADDLSITALVVDE
jgi:hypothetical protein